MSQILNAFSGIFYSNFFTEPTLRQFITLIILHKPIYFNHEDEKWDQETIQKPEVDHFKVCRFNEQVRDALIHGVHNQHDGQGETDGQLCLRLVKVKRDLSNDEQGDCWQIGVGQMV